MKIGNCKLEMRRSGQKSSSSKTNGSVTTIGLLINPQRKKGERKDVKDFGLRTLDFGQIRKPDIRQERQQPEKSAQNILAFGRPRNRFDMQRMPREQRRDERAAPQRAGGSTQKDKQQQGICDVEEQVDEMMRAGVDTEQRAVQSDATAR